MAVLDVESVVKSFTPGVRVLDDVTIHVDDGEIACRSSQITCGCGKTSRRKYQHEQKAYDSNPKHQQPHIHFHILMDQT